MSVAGCVPLRSKTPAKNVLDAALTPDDLSKWDKKIAKDAKRAINLEKEYKRLKAGLKKCDTKLSYQKKLNAKRRPTSAPRGTLSWKSNRCIAGSALAGRAL